MQPAHTCFRLAAALAAALLLTACGNDRAPPEPARIYSLSGNVTGLSAGTLTLTNTANGDSIDLTTNGSFSFDEALADEEAYAVVVTTQPLNLTCTVTDGDGILTSDAAADIGVRCVTAQYSIGGSVSGLAGNLLLQNNNGDDLAISSNGAFTFATRITANTAYRVTVRNQPANQTCTVGNGSGTVSGGNYTGAMVQCVNNSNPFTVGGTVSGLSGTLVIQNNGGNNLALAANGAFAFSSPLNSGTAYAVSILTQPFGQQCSVSNGTGTVTANVTGIDIQCVPGTYSVGGTITGLSSIFSLKNNGETINRTIGGPFVFPTRVAHGATYDVTINTQPFGQVCTVNNGSGTINGANVIDVAVACVPKQYTLGFQVQNLAGTLLLGNAGVNNSVSADGNYTFSVPVRHGDTYEMTIAAQPVDQTCAISNARGTALANVTDILVTCGFEVQVSVAAPKTLLFNWTARPGATHYRLLKNNDGNSGYTVIADNLGLTTSTEVIATHLHDWLDASYIVEACIDAQCNPSVPVYTTGLMLQSIGYFKASNPGASDGFGHIVALSDDGSTLAIGALNEDSNATGANGNQLNDDVQNAGAVYVFVRSGATWVQQAYLKASNTDPNDAFGSSLALSANGNYLAVAAPGESSAATGINGNQADDTAPNAGAVYMFKRTAGAWAQQAYIKASDANTNDFFGSALAATGIGSALSISADGATLAVGAPMHATETASTEDTDPLLRGAVYVFTRAATTWTQQALLEAFNGDDYDFYGYSVSLSDDGNTLAVGAPNESSIASGVDGDSANNLSGFSGAAYVYTRSGSSWNHQAYVKSTNNGGQDRFGYSVKLSGDGNTLAIASMFEDSAPNSTPDDNTLPDSGAIYVLTRSGNVWTHEAMLKDSQGSASDNLGFALAVSNDGNTIAASAFGDDSDAVGIGGDSLDLSAHSAGGVIVFRRESGTWQQRAYVKATNTEASDSYGSSVGLSADGGTLAVGAPRESGGGTGLGGPQGNNDIPGAGAVYLY